MWPSAEGIGKDIRENSWFVYSQISGWCNFWGVFIAMMGNCHYKLAVMDLSIIAVTLTPSWLVWISQLCQFGCTFHHSCFVFEYETKYTILALAVFDFYLRKVQEMVGHSAIWRMVWQLSLSCSMFYTLIEQAVSTNDSAHYICTSS